MTEGTSRQSLPKVLVVDDRPENLVALEAILQGMPIQSVGVTSGEAALKQLLKCEFALILMDAYMPEMDGFETARRIKQRDRTRTVPIVFLTAANYDSHLALRGYEAGAVDYISKPIDPWVLRAKVSVFADLWDKDRRVRDQAALTARYERQLRAATDKVARAMTLLAELHGESTVENELHTLLQGLSDDMQH